MPERSQNESAIVKGLADEYTDTTPLNQLEFLIKTLTRDMSTAIPVIITAVQAGDTNAAGYVDARPLVAQIDAWGNALPMAAIHHLPYFRLQSGVAAVVIDPVPGDIGLAVFAQSDCSNVKQGANQTVQPGSWRKFDQADGFYVGGFLNKPASVWIKLTQDGAVYITAPNGVHINAPTLDFEGGGAGRKVTISGDVDITGTVDITGDMISGGKSYLDHTHMGVHGETTPPL